MYPIYRFFYNLVGFSRNQTNGFLLFLPLLIGITISPAILRWYVSRQEKDHAADVAKLEQLVSEWRTFEGKARSDSIQQSPIPSTSQVDINTAGLDQFNSLGFDRQVAERIITYRQRGGKFRSKRDLLRIYGLDSVFFQAVEENLYVSTPHIQQQKASGRRRDVDAAKKVLSRAEHYDLNKADTTQLKKVYGIGEKLALRIIKYKDVLGGFISIDQVGEVYKLDSAVLKRIKQKFFIDDHFEPLRLNINTAGRQELAAHPYISDRAADAIVAYRFQHGKFGKLEDLRRIPLIDSVMLLRTGPYLEAK
jgi:competence protein ComEA